MPERHALVIANGAYQDPRFRPLRSPATDSSQLSEVLADPAIGGYQVQRVADEPYSTMVEKIGDFLADRGREDTLLLYISGHGVRDADGDLYFAAANTRIDRLDETALSAERLARQIARSRARKILLLLDCCFAGAFPGGRQPKSSEEVDLSSLPSAGHVVITATSATEYAFEGDHAEGEAPRASVFTQALVLGLSTGDADRNGDGSVTIADLFEYLTDSLRSVTPAQTPTMHGTGLQGEFVVARHPSPIGQTRPTEPPPSEDGCSARELVWVAESMDSVLDQLEANTAAGRIATGFGLPSGHAELDSITAGFGPGELVLVAGEGGAGKSTLAQGIARACAIHSNVKALYATYESTHPELMTRLLAGEAKVPLTHLRDGKLTDDDWARLARVIGRVSSAPLAICDDPTMRLESLAKTVEAADDLRLLVVDNLQLLADSDDPAALLGAIRSLKLIATARGLTVVSTVATDETLAALGNPVGVLARYADVVINVFRPELYDWEDRPGEADLMVVKNRHGHGRTVVVAFQGHYARFVDLAD